MISHHNHCHIYTHSHNLLCWITTIVTLAATAAVVTKTQIFWLSNRIFGYLNNSKWKCSQFIKLNLPFRFLKKRNRKTINNNWTRKMVSSTWKNTKKFVEEIPKIQHQSIVNEKCMKWQWAHTNKKIFYVKLNYFNFHFDIKSELYFIELMKLYTNHALFNWFSSKSEKLVPE